jgi:hypothetical protein
MFINLFTPGGKVVLLILYPKELGIAPLCGLVVRVPGYRSKDPGSIPGTTRLSEK